MDDATLLRLWGAMNEPKPGAAGQGNGPRPKELSDPNTDPQIRAKVLDAYTGFLTDKPSSSWSESEKADIRAQIEAVCKANNIGS